MAQDANADHVEKYSSAISIARNENRFQQWFASSKSNEQARVSGYWDFSIHILTPTVCSYIHNPWEQTALEIGFGGGRLLNAACGFFNHAIGVDIHSDLDMTEILLKKNGVSNFSLYRGDGETLPVSSSSVDFLYSFITFLHLQSFKTFCSYLTEIYRCLKTNGIAQIYYQPCADNEFIEHSAPANHASLQVRQDIAELSASKAGLVLVDSGKSYKSVPNGFPKEIGQQLYMTLLKR